MNSKQKKIFALFQTLTKLGHDRDAEIEELIKGIGEAINKGEGLNPSSEEEDIVTKTDRGLSMKVPLYVALRHFGMLPENLLDVDEDEA